MRAKWLEKLCNALSENRRKCCKDCTLLLANADPLQSEPLYCPAHSDQSTLLETCAEMEFTAVRACAASKTASYNFKVRTSTSTLPVSSHAVSLNNLVLSVRRTLCSKKQITVTYTLLLRVYNIQYVQYYVPLFCIHSIS